MSAEARRWVETPGDAGSLPPPGASLSPILQAALELQTFCEARSWRYFVLKAFAGRDIDWVDVRGIAVRQAGRLDEDLIFRELEPLVEVKGSTDSADRLREILRKAAER
jgi:hypothetical protein